MNTQSIQNTIQEHMKTLPHDVQEAIHGSSWERKILDIGRRYGLHVDQLEVLQTELSLAVLGLVGREEFVKETMREAAISRQIMDPMILDINREIFEPIRNHLKQTRTREETLESVSEEQTASGLRSHEEEELQKHGVSFNLDEEQATTTAGSVYTQQEKEPLKQEQQKPQSILSKPLTLSPQKNPSSSVSFDQSIQTSIQPKKTEAINTQAVNSNPVQNQIEPIIQGANLDPNSLPGAETESHQDTISDSGGTFYGGSDPYREPVA